MTFLWDFYWVPVRCSWYFNWISMGLLCASCGNSMLVLWKKEKDLKVMSLEFLLDSYGFCMVLWMIFYAISLGFLWDFHDISIGFLWHFFETTMRSKQVFYGILMGLLWHPYKMSMMFLWCFYGIAMGVLKEFYGILKGFLCGSYAIPMLSLESFYYSFCGIPIVFPWYFDGITLGFQLKVSWKHFKITGKNIAINWKAWIENQLKANWNQIEINWK